MSFLSGPIYIGETRHKNKDYLFLGDHHLGFENNCVGPCRDLDNNIDANCTELNRYLVDLFKRAEYENEYIDIFIEAFYKTKEFRDDRKGYFGYLSLFKQKFKDCIYNLSDCDYKNVRFHYSDTRTTDNFEALFLHSFLYNYYKDLIFDFSQLFYNNRYNNYRPRSKSIEDLITFMDWFYSPTRPDIDLFIIYLTSNNYIKDVNTFLAPIKNIIGYVPEIIEKVLYNPKMSVYRYDQVFSRLGIQLEELHDIELSNNIVYYLMQKYKETILDKSDFQLFKNVYNCYLQKQDGPVLKYVFSKRHLFIIPGSSVALIMDAYTLPRILRHFKPVSSMVIVYAGLAHIRVYVEFFEKYLYKRIKSFPVDIEKLDIINPSRCINIL